MDARIDLQRQRLLRSQTHQRSSGSIGWSRSFTPIEYGCIKIRNSSDSTFANVATSVGYDFSGSNSDDPGTWSVAVTPLPSGLPLFACGLGALGLFGWRQRKIPHTAL
jgi:hypothetical protein